MSKILRDIPIEKQIAKHMQRWERRREEWQRQTTPTLRPPLKKLGPYISISRELGSGGVEISHRVAEKLQWQHFDREVIEAIADRTHAREDFVARFDEHIRSELDTYLRNLFTWQRFDNTQYLCQLSQVLLGIAQYGQAVILGRGANFVLPPEAGLRVRVVAPMDVRVHRLMEANDYDEKRATEEIAAQDKVQRAFIHHHFRRELADPLAYDVMINTGQLELEMAVDLIIQLAEAKLKADLE